MNGNFSNESTLLNVSTIIKIGTLCVHISAKRHEKQVKAI